MRGMALARELVDLGLRQYGGERRDQFTPSGFRLLSYEQQRRYSECAETLQIRPVLIDRT